ncbi:hypothetical protein AAHE18_01G083400 [Arachis hypogaea]|uniref:RING-type E3 ubiquitin transferase n=2 Tax=Arachis hypogaea TaxID=3818 RepID=A0A445ETP5_ARAHY|nr:RING-H2 finger protein [Arachis hypogaea]RYR78874.1 hypothetical protein Ahy_A01g003742 isoform A [Arachis hypogaea]
MSSSEAGYKTPDGEYNTPPALIAFTLAVLVLCFMAFSVVYLCKYCFVSVLHSWAFHQSFSGSLLRPSSTNRSSSIGLDPSMLQTFPTFVYSSVKDLRSLECAICLLEFQDDSLIRLLTICCHVFHQECIDLWLYSHKTCPVCRTNLEEHKSGEGEISGSSGGADIRIDIITDMATQGSGGHQGTGGEDHSCNDEHDHNNNGVQQEHKFARSHSTGHSIVFRGEEEEKDDKYTLRLPRHIIRGRHHYSKSCTSFQEMQMTTSTRPCSNCGFVESVSSCSTSLAHIQIS